MKRVRVVWSGGPGVPYISTHYFSDGTSAESAVAVTGIFWAAVDAMISNLYDWDTEPDVTEMDEDGTITGVTGIASVGGSGAGSSEALPVATQALLQWRTSVYLGGRELRGRTFIPGLTSGANDDGRLAGANITLLEEIADDYINAPSAVPLVWSRKNAAAYPITVATAWSEFAVLRSRRD